MRLELVRRLNAIPGISIPEDVVDRYPSIYLSALKDEAVLKQFLAVLDWVIEEIRRANVL